MITTQELEMIWAEVMRRFPKLEIESRCRTEKEFRQRARESYKQRLTDEFTATKNISQANRSKTLSN
jgi:hypothetical protein